MMKMIKLPDMLKLRWLLNKQVGWALLWIVVLGLVAITINLIGVRLVGDAQSWTLWLKSHAPVFMLWRVCLYSAVGYGWWWMRQRVVLREQSQLHPETGGDAAVPGNGVVALQRLHRVEIAAVVAIVLLEGMTWLEQAST